MDSSTCIEQKGVIEEINKGIARVNITSFSACANCHSKQGCGMAETSDKEIIVALSDSALYRVGEIVTVTMQRAMGWKAALIAYFVPFVLVILTLLILTSLHFSEVISGLGALLILFPYFLGIFLMREKLKTAFKFSIRKGF